MQPGDTIGRYRLDALLGEGAMATVFAATHPHRERKLAVKVLKPEARGDADYLRRFFADARAADALDHPNIVRVHDVDEADGVPFIVMELIDGEPLDRLLAEGGQFDVEQATRIVREIASALAAAHAAGTIHRDVKPSNIIIDGLTGRAKLTDFGAAKRINGDGVVKTAHGQLIGTPRYMAPEQFEHGEVDGRTDLFALGATFYEMLAGQPAFPGGNIGTVAYAIVHSQPKPIPELRPDVPSDTLRVLDRLLAKSPDDRLASAADVVAALTPDVGATQRILIPTISRPESDWAEPPTPDIEPPPAPETLPLWPKGAVQIAPPEPEPRRLAPVIALVASILIVMGGLSYLVLSFGWLFEGEPVDTASDKASVHPEPPRPPPEERVQPTPQPQQAPSPPQTAEPAQPQPEPAVDPPPPQPPIRLVCEERPPDPGCALASRLMAKIGGDSAAGPLIVPNHGDGVYLDGDYVVLDAAMPPDQGGFLYVDVVTADGTVFHFLPEPKRKDNVLPAGGTIRLGVEAAEERPGERVWRAGPPFGPGYVIALSSDRSLLEVPAAPSTPLRDYESGIMAALDRATGAPPRIDVTRIEFKPKE